MVRAVTSGHIRESIGNEVRHAVVEWAKKFVKYCNSKWPEWEVEVITGALVSQDVISFVGKHESIAAHRQSIEGFWQDRGAQELWEEFLELERTMGNQPAITGWTNHYYNIHEPG